MLRKLMILDWNPLCQVNYVFQDVLLYCIISSGRSYDVVSVKLRGLKQHFHLFRFGSSSLIESKAIGSQATKQLTL